MNPDKEKELLKIIETLHVQATGESTDTLHERLTEEKIDQKEQRR